ncbi:MAG TPA: hypothetical protein V6C65_06660 [Allocoleopsis sp.]
MPNSEFKVLFQHPGAVMVRVLRQDEYWQDAYLSNRLATPHESELS